MTREQQISSWLRQIGEELSAAADDPSQVSELLSLFELAKVPLPDLERTPTVLEMMTAGLQIRRRGA